VFCFLAVIFNAGPQAKEIVREVGGGHNAERWPCRYSVSIDALHTSSGL
jgi:hypothetical protein